MTDEQIEILKRTYLKKEQLLWSPDSTTARRITAISTHVEEGDDELCAIFSNGQYANLHNACFFDFFIIKELPHE